MWRSSEQSHWVESLKLQPVPLPELQDTVRSAGPRKSAALLLGPQCVSGAGESLGSLGTFLLAFPIASDLDEPSRQGPASLQEQLAGQAFSALTEAVGPSGSPVHSGEKEATSVSVRVGQGWLRETSMAGGLRVASQSPEAARAGGANTHPSKWALGLETHRL